MAGELLIVTGPPGAGKSTVAPRLAEHRSPSVLIEGDAFFGFLRRGQTEPWLVEAHEQNEVVTSSAGAATGQFVTGGYWTVYDGMIGPWFLPRFVAATRLERVHYVVLLPAAETCVDRVANRIGHGFADEAATRHMHEHFATADLARRHVIHEFTGDTSELVDSIVERVDAGQLVFPG